MIGLVQGLQVLSGALWLLPALFLAPRVWRTWGPYATRMDALSSPICFFSWVQVGFIARWLLWPDSAADMSRNELAMWASLYALSCWCALTVFAAAWKTRGE